MKPLPFRLICAGLLLILTGCKQDPLVLADLEADLSKAKSEVSKVKQAVMKARSDLQATTDKIREFDETVAATRLSIQDALAQVTSLENRFTDYRAQYRTAIQKRSPGMELAPFVLDGKAYVNVRVSKLDSWEVSIQHKDGFIRFSLADLPADMRELLGYDPNAGPRPFGSSVASQVNLYVPTPKMPSAEGGASPPPVAQSTPGVAGPPGTYYPPPAGRSKKRKPTPVSPIITTWGPTQGATGGGGGSTISGASASVPEGYRPIGSSYGGNDMDKKYKKK